MISHPPEFYMSKIGNIMHDISVHEALLKHAVLVRVFPTRETKGTYKGLSRSHRLKTAVIGRKLLDVPMI